MSSPDFPAATALLRERGLITASAEGRYVTLAEGHSTAEITQALVSAGMAVEGIWQQEQSVEDFYMSLVKPPPLPIKS